MALDEATAFLLSQMAQPGAVPLHEMSVAEARAMVAGLKELFGEGPDMATVFDAEIPAIGTDIAVRVYVPEADAIRGAIVYYHGGGWVVGAIDEYDVLARQIAQNTSSIVFVVDYRLAPEHPYPTAAEDAWSALGWVANHLAEHGQLPPLVVMGDSAGGNLAAVVARRAVAEDGPALAAQVLVYPVTDSDFDTESYLDPENQLVLNRDAMKWFWNHYAPDESVRGNSDIAPLRAGDFAGLAPAIVLTAEHDPLRDEGEAYARKLQEADVPVAHRRVAGQMHGFFTMPNVLPGAATGMDFVTEHLAQYLEPAGQPSA